jgi:predicted RecB family endonuclease
MDSVALVLTTVATQLASRSWRVISEKIAAHRGPKSDMVIQDPRGRTYVIEVKLGEGQAHFSEVAQVESVANDLRNDEREPVTPVLVTNRQVPPSIRGVAQTVGVEIVQAFGSERDVANALVQHLDGHATGGTAVPGSL